MIRQCQDGPFRCDAVCVFGDGGGFDTVGGEEMVENKDGFPARTFRTDDWK